MADIQATVWDEPATAAPNPSTENAWVKKFDTAVVHLLSDWRDVAIQHDSVMQFRREAGLPTYDDELWTEGNEIAFQEIEHVVNVIAHYYLELKDGLRGIGHAMGDVGVLAEMGETQIVIDNAKIMFRNAGQNRPGADPNGFIGLTGVEVALGVAGAIVVVAVTVGTVYAVTAVCSVIRDRLAAVREKSMQAYEKSQIDSGVSPAEAHQNALGYMNHSEKLSITQNTEPNPGGEIVGTVKTALMVTLVVALVGGAIYFVGPMVRESLATRAHRPQLAQANPVRDVDDFTHSYIETALWSSHDESDESGGEPMDRNYTISDIAPETLKKMISDCERFQNENSEWLSERSDQYGGHDFWLTRNGHGAGFWDGDWSEEAGEGLTAASKKYGEFDLYVGDDGLFYGQKG
jgi:hypothetical protein